MQCSAGLIVASSKPRCAMRTLKNSRLQSVNIKYLSPTVLLFFSILFFLLALPVLPIDVQYPITANAMIFWLICSLSFLVGTLLGAGSRFKMHVNKVNVNPSTLKKFLLIVILIGLAGSVLLIIDRYFIRGVSLTTDVFENRGMLVDSQPSTISAIAAMASSIGVFSYILIWIIELNVFAISRWFKLLAIINLFVTVAISVQIGSRSLLMVFFMIHLFAWLFVIKARGQKIQTKHKIMVLSLLLLLAIISSIIMVWRVELMGFSALDSITTSGYTYTIQPSTFILSYLQYDGSLRTEVLAGLFSLVQYVFHGIYEFSLLFNNFQGEHEMGAITLWLPIKLASILTGGWIHFDSADNIGIRYGIFTTFVGPVFVDFGWLSPFPLMVYGILVGLPFRLLQKGRIEWLPTVVLIAACMLLWPVVNILISASGMYLLVGAVAIGLMGKRLRSTSRRKKLC